MFMAFKIKFVQPVLDVFRDMAHALHSIADVLARSRRPAFSLKGGNFMFIVKADHPDAPYKITPPTIEDSEGNPVENPNLAYELSSSNGAVVDMVADNDNDPLTGVFHFGQPGQASVNVNVLFEGKIIGAFGAQFTVTAGDPARIVGGGITVEGLTEA